MINCSVGVKNISYRFMLQRMHCNLLYCIGGWCERYKQQGERCSGMSKMNGHCECAPGLKCKWFKDPTLGPIVLHKLTTMSMKPRSMIFGGGHSECQPIWCMMYGINKKTWLIFC